MANTLVYSVCVATESSLCAGGLRYHKIGEAFFDNRYIEARSNLHIVTNEFILRSEKEEHFTKGRIFTVLASSTLNEDDRQSRISVGTAFDSGNDIVAKLNLDYVMAEYVFYLDELTTRDQHNAGVS